MSNKIEITQFKSAIGYNKKTKATIKALGIKKLNSPVVVNNDPAHVGMVNKVKHLVRVREL
ncbi:MAG: 50S ribosomal protein L30 [Candidatus Marinimicrobia bacterium]|nr:50S ribosomal protein L30 [Candidatus Neomarinimicrobiota bacterium]|tara:strand:- start:107 stop:289 length:183 start_codon:yes stop_codon:yes gene_type:complete